MNYWPMETKKVLGEKKVRESSIFKQLKASSENHLHFFFKYQYKVLP